MPAPHVSLIILNWNGLSLLKQTLPSVVATRYDNLEIVVADNASQDRSVDWLRATYPEIRIIRHPENWGFCKGNNEAIRQTSGDYVLLLNNDVEVEPDWLQLLVSRIGSNPRIAAVQPKLLQYGQRSRFEYAGGSGGYLDRLAYPFTRGRLFGTLESDTGQYDDARPIFWATGAALLLRRAALEKVGLLDESFYLHMEEIDLCWRLARAGYAVFVEPASVVYHIGGSSLPHGHPDKIYYNFRNSLLMLYKNLPPAVWRRTFPLRILADVAAALRTVAVGGVRDTLAILRAYRDAHVMKRTYRDARPPAKRDAILPTYRGSVAIDYFVRGRKTFGSLPSSRFSPFPFEQLREGKPPTPPAE